MPFETTDRIYLQLWPDWSPSSAAGVARFPALLKVGAGASVDPAATIQIRLRDADGEVLAVETTGLGGPIAGPAWRELPGGLVAIPDAVASAEAALGDVVSAAAARSDGELAVQLEPVGGALGLPGEPHLWWCYRNQGDEPVAVADVLRETVLLVDGEQLRPPPVPYNGPSRLPPRRALSGWWSLDSFEAVGPHRPHRFVLKVLGGSSEEFTFSW
jgi:hypothetical protein